MLEVRITNYAKSGEENPVVVIEKYPESEYIGIYINNEAARVEIEELEKAIQACKHQKES